MAQNAGVMAYRKRMKHRGYTDIHICEIPDKPGVYLVSAVEPACKVRVEAEVDFRSMPERCTGKRQRGYLPASNPVQQQR